jgi:hypothetical protein
MSDNYSQVYQSQEWNYEDYKKLAITAKDDVKAIREEVYSELTSDATLNLMNSSSDPALWELYADVISFVFYLLHSLWTVYEQRLKSAAAAAIAHNSYWYALRSTEFQLGDTLTVINGAVVYPVVDTTKRIIAAAAVKDGDQGSLIIKVAKKPNTALEPLTPVELAAFEGYVNGFKDAGVDTLVISQNPDVLKLELIIYYNPIVLVSALQTEVEAAIVDYIENLPFDGIFRRTKLIDAIQSIEEIKDIQITTCEASVAYTSSPNYMPIEVFYETLAGYIVIDTNYPLSGQINYVPHA